MKTQILKIADCKTEAQFYKKFPTMDAFMKIHGKEFKKAQREDKVQKAQGGYSFPNITNGYQDYHSTSPMNNVPMQNTLKPASFSYPQIQAPSSSQISQGIAQQAAPAEGGIMSMLGGAVPLLGSVGKIIGGFKASKEAKKQIKTDRINNRLLTLQNQVADLPPEVIERNYNRPEDMIVSNPNAQGTDWAKKGGKIKSLQVGGIPQGYQQFGNMATSLIQNSIGESAVGDITGGIAGGIGSFFGMKELFEPVGQFIGSKFDKVGNESKKLAKENSALQESLFNKANTRNFQGAKSSFMKEGGNPQIISEFGGHSLKELLKKDPKMDTLRSGGHLKEDYVPIAANGTEINTLWGGQIRPASYNPFSAGSGISHMANGNSHEERDGRGNTGIGIEVLENGGIPTGEADVEVQGGEPIVKVGEEDPKNIVLGDLKLHKPLANSIGMKEFAGKKYQDIGKKLMEKESKVYKSFTEDVENLGDFKSVTPFDRIKENTLTASSFGKKEQLKDLADKKELLANTQEKYRTISEIANIDYDSMFSKNPKFNKPSKNKETKTAQSGETIGDGLEMVDENLEGAVVPFQFKSRLNPTTYKQEIAQSAQHDFRKGNETPYEAITTQASPQEEFQPVSVDTNTLSLLSGLISPYIPRSSDAMDLDPAQLQSKYNTLATNKVEPVWGTQYTHELSNVSKISLQAQKNNVISEIRAAQKLAGYNPAAMATIAAQSYNALNEIDAKELAINQERQDKVIESNKIAMNDAKLKNIELAMAQQAKQDLSKSNTKAINQAALNSIGEKVAKNKLENRTLQVAENLYNYRYNDDYQIQNRNPLQFFTPNASASGEKSPYSLEEYFDKEEELKAIKESFKKKTKTARNGGIVRSFK